MRIKYRRSSITKHNELTAPLMIVIFTQLQINFGDVKIFEHRLFHRSDEIRVCDQLSCNRELESAK